MDGVAPASIGPQGRPVSPFVSAPLWHIVIVNYKTASMAAQAARTARQCAPEARVIVVDSASEDDCGELVAREKNIEYLGLTENRGYGAALNAGVGNSSAEYLLLLNADLELAPGTVSHLQTRFESLPTLGVVAPRLRSANGQVQPSCRRFPTHRSLLASRGSPFSYLGRPQARSYRLPEPNSFTLTDVVAGACLAVRQQVWRDLGGMDPAFVLYAEDSDFCFRAKKAGWLVGYEPAVSVQHEWGASRRKARRQSNLQHAESLSRYFYKHYPERRWANLAVSCLMRLHARLRF